MNSKLKKTLVAIFQNPTPKNINWNDIESLLMGLGADIIEGNGSRVRFIPNNSMIVFHRPHPSKEAKTYQVKDVRNFLKELKITP